MNDQSIPDWVYETLRNDDLRVYENSNGKVIISQVSERHKEDIMTPQAIISFLKSIKKKPVVMHPRIFALGRHVPKRDVIAVLSERVEVKTCLTCVHLGDNQHCERIECQGFSGWDRGVRP